mmetsp:Transcript_36699/g.55368  ORF Transcript_36699/g.55368 Transcript_36699/m.55368 type:complete len:92 (+) Transcript_36699:93-368(+)|eukprot:CAMPEP_0206443542 /NCGR_PEP_ID=MMETSP0324_2-20121206/14423_1 /ASSEMBLY_ACC=CAM_ASM_000836 /TAXON_ID=2866 /ORGANISM="Crypthecodinium cohnii, Strain Seligo" /LENGTH=91 /DNA_ID=CAMNT_0053911483 /DNA_START=69 /DNA_END=344 /DNA_ORIENTATION=-
MERSLMRLAKMGPSKGRGPLNTKRAPALKKGYGSIGLGRHTRKGFFFVNPLLFPMLKVPDLSDFELQPYVSRNTPVISNAHPYWKTGKFKP